MYDAGLVDAVLHFTGLDFFDGLRHVKGHRSGFGVRHKTSRAKNATQLTHRLHHVRSRNTGIEIEPTALNFCDKILTTNKFSSGFFGFADFLTRCDHTNALGLAQAVRQHNRAPYHLVGMLGINSEPHVQLDGLVKLCKLNLLKSLDRLIDGIHPIFDLFGGLAVILGYLCHFLASYDLETHATSCPFNNLNSRFQARRIQVRHFRAGDLLDLFFSHLAHLGLVRLPGSFGYPS